MKPLTAILGLLLASGTASAQPVDWARSTPVDVGLESFKFVPDTLRLKQGQVYTIHFHNDSSGGHDFVAKDFFAKAQIAPASRTAVEHGEVELHGGSAADVTLVAPSAGTYKIHCSHFMHETMGMSGRIIVD